MGSKCGTRSSFKGFVMLVVMMLMTASSAMAEEAKFEVIGGLCYLLDTGAKTATLMPKTDSKYSFYLCTRNHESQSWLMGVKMY